VGVKFESLECPPFIVTETKKFRDAIMESVADRGHHTRRPTIKVERPRIECEMVLLRITKAISMECVGHMKKQV
jgi:hypothetical protein